MLKLFKRIINKLQHIRINKKYTVNIFTFIKSILIIICILYTCFDFTMSIYNKNIKNNIITVEPKKIYYNYVVVSDDTLWNIAKKQSKNIDTRILVEIIKDDNNLLNSD